MALDRSTSWQNIPVLIDKAFQEIEHLANSFPHIRDGISTKKIRDELISSFERQMNRNKIQDTEALKVLSKFPSGYYYSCEGFDGHYIYYMTGSDDFRRPKFEWEKFKKAYLVMAKNLIASLNAVRLRDRASWIDVKEFAGILAKVKYEQPKESLKEEPLFTVEDYKFLLED